MPPDPRDAELIETAASVVAKLVIAHARTDHASIAVEIGRLLNAVARYTNGHTERPSDEALRCAVARLSR